MGSPGAVPMRTALVTGATRGVGRGIAVALGAAGWRVWVTGRSTAGGTGASHLPGTVEETADAVTGAGGRGIAAVCDHRDDDQVRAVVAGIAAAGEGLDMLVNNVWAGYERLSAGAWEEWNAPFWEQPLVLWDAMFTGGVRAHYVATALCAPLLVQRPGALVVTVSEQVGTRHQSHYGVAYSTAKAADERLTLASGTALAPFGVTAVALHPGLVRTEAVMQFAEHLDLARSQSPEDVGRVVAALADDPDRGSENGKALSVEGLAVRYGTGITGP